MNSHYGSDYGDGFTTNNVTVGLQLTIETYRLWVWHKTYVSPLKLDSFQWWIWDACSREHSKEKDESEPMTWLATTPSLYNVLTKL